MLRKIKKLLNKVLQALGWGLKRYNVSCDPSLQLFSALSHVQTDIVFDIGANTGQFAQQLRATGFAGTIVSFDPLTTAHAALTAAAAADSAWLVHPRAAVGDEDGEININIAGNSVSSSVLPMLDAHSSAAPGSAYVSSERAPLVRLDSVAGQYLDASSRLFIKIDTQGFEWQVLDGAIYTLRQAQGVLLEVSLTPLYEGQKLWLEMVKRLELEGFTLWALQNGFTDPHTGRSLQVDAIFLRV